MAPANLPLLGAYCGHQPPLSGKCHVNQFQGPDHNILARFRSCYTRQCFLQRNAIARQVAEEIARVTPPLCNLSRNEKLRDELHEVAQYCCVYFRDQHYNCTHAPRRKAAQFAQIVFHCLLDSVSLFLVFRTLKIEQNFVSQNRERRTNPCVVLFVFA